MKTKTEKATSFFERGVIMRYVSLDVHVNPNWNCNSSLLQGARPKFEPGTYPAARSRAIHGA
jgi:hypothetical protein